MYYRAHSGMFSSKCYRYRQQPLLRNDYNVNTKWIRYITIQISAIHIAHIHAYAPKYSGDITTTILIVADHAFSFFSNIQKRFVVNKYIQTQR